MKRTDSPFHHVLAHCDIEIEDSENALEGLTDDANDYDYIIEQAARSGVDIKAELLEHRVVVRLLELAEEIPFDTIMKAKKMILE